MFRLTAFVIISLILFRSASAVDPPMTQDLIAALSAPDLALSDYWKFRDDLYSLPENERHAAMLQLVAQAAPQYAATMAASLIQEGVENAAFVIGQEVINWPDHEQRLILQRIQSANAAEQFRPVAHALLEDAIANPESYEEFHSGQECFEPPVGLAALLLAGSGDPDDEQLIRSAMHELTKSAGLWIAAHQRGIIGPVEAAIAGPVWSDTGIPVHVRLAAAVAVSDESEPATQFIVEQYESFLDEYENYSIEHAVGALYDGSATAQERQEYVAFRCKARILSFLQYFDAEESHDLTFRSIASENVIIRTTAELIAIDHWPDDLLAYGQGEIPDEEYVVMLAALSLQRPDLTSQIENSVDIADLNSAKAMLLEHGIAGGFSFAAPIINGF